MQALHNTLALIFWAKDKVSDDAAVFSGILAEENN